MDSEAKKLRDQFAIAALSGGLQQEARDDMDAWWWYDAAKIAARAYEIADAMLKARK